MHLIIAASCGCKASLSSWAAGDEPASSLTVMLTITGGPGNSPAELLGMALSSS